MMMGNYWVQLRRDFSEPLWFSAICHRVSSLVTSCMGLPSYLVHGMGRAWGFLSSVLQIFISNCLSELAYKYSLSNQARLNSGKIEFVGDAWFFYVDLGDLWVAFCQSSPNYQDSYRATGWAKMETQWNRCMESSCNGCDWNWISSQVEHLLGFKGEWLPHSLKASAGNKVKFTKCKRNKQLGCVKRIQVFLDGGPHVKSYCFLQEAGLCQHQAALPSTKATFSAIKFIRLLDCWGYLPEHLRCML